MSSTKYLCKHLQCDQEFQQNLISCLLYSFSSLSFPVLPFDSKQAFSILNTFGHQSKRHLKLSRGRSPQED